MLARRLRYSARVGATLYPWTAEDFAALREACAKLGCSPEDLLLTIALETGNTFDPGAAFRRADGYPSAIGLNQITDASAKAMVISEDERLSLLTMTPAEQLPYVARSFLAARGNNPFETPPDAVTLYQTNIAPSTVGRDVIFTQKEFPCPPAREAKTYYCANAGLDANKDGVIDRTDLAVKLDGFRNGANYQRMIELLGATATSESSRAAGLNAPLPLLAGILAVGGYALYRVNK
jgi:hypothetical protein